jgi:hypothetical protein
MASCHRPQCDRYAPPGRAFCPDDWRRVPNEVKRVVYVSKAKVDRGERDAHVHAILLAVVAEGLDGRSWADVCAAIGGRPPRVVASDDQAVA